MAMREHVKIVICLAALGGTWAENASCEAWGYGAENHLNCYGSIGGMEGNPNHACWAELTSRPTCCGYCGPWAGSADGSSWVSTCNDLDIIRVTPGCSFELETAGGQRFTFHEDTRVCGNTVGCDSVRRIRVFGNGQPPASRLPTWNQAHEQCNAAHATGIDATCCIGSDIAQQCECASLGRRRELSPFHEDTRGRELGHCCDYGAYCDCSTLAHAKPSPSLTRSRNVTPC